MQMLIFFFFKSKGRKWHYFVPLHFVCKDVEFVNNKDAIYFIMQYLETCYQGEYKPFSFMKGNTPPFKVPEALWGGEYVGE